MTGAVPLVSVCLPTKDRLAYLRQSIDGILAQTFRDFEIVVSDNWSSDGTREYLVELARRDPRVRYSRPTAPIGLYANHNAAFADACGRYVGFVHDDDLYRPSIIERFVGFLEEHPRVGVVSCDWDRIDEKGRMIRRRIAHVALVVPGRDYIERTLRSARSDIALPASMARREALPDPLFDESGPLGFSDHVTWFRLAESWDVGHIPERLWSYRQHSSALSNKRVAAIVDDQTEAYTRYVDDYERRHPGEAERVTRWRAAVKRYRFWALLYEVALKGGGHDRERTRAVLAELSALSHGTRDRVAVSLARAAARWGGGALLSVVTRNADLARRVLHLD